jgi:hypothetical protein
LAGDELANHLELARVPRRAHPLEERGDAGRRTLCSPAVTTTARQLRAFLERPWTRLRAAKDRHTAAVIARDGADRAFQLAALLRDHAVAMGAHASPAERRADLDAAVALRRKLDRAGRRPRRAR